MEQRLKYTVTNPLLFAALIAGWVVAILAVVVGGILTDKLAFGLGVAATVMASWVKYNGKGLFS